MFGQTDMMRYPDNVGRSSLEGLAPI